MVETSKATVVENIYKNFYDLYSAISNFNVSPAFPTKKIDAKATYPLMVLSSPEISWDAFTFNRDKIEGTISLEICTTDAKTCDQYASDAIDKIETSRHTLHLANLDFIYLDSTDKDVIVRGKITVHIKKITFSYRFVFTRTTL